MIKDTLYYQYIKERMKADVIEADHGFVTFRLLGEECFVCDIYVEENERRKSVCRDLIEGLTAKAKEAGCKYIAGRIYLNDNGKERTLQAAFGIGFKLLRSDHDSVLVFKEI